MKSCGLKTNKLHRMIAAAVCVAMLVGLIFQVTLFSAPGGENVNREQAVTRGADGSTINSWQDFFETDTGTSNAGKIWTDKTVVDGDITLQSIEGDNSHTTVSRQGTDNFLVGLSALSSNKTITGESALPMDVVFVLDVSESMIGNAENRKMGMLVKAVNSTIKEILELNKENRIGVILYSGVSGTGISTKETATCPLPLDRYENKKQPDTYFSLNRNYDEIQVADGVVNSNGDQVEPGTRVVSGYTYMQNGLMASFEELKKNSAEQETKRIPVITLMSDGAATAANENYTQRGDSTVGQGNYTDIRMTFLTQLTAAWIKQQLRTCYETEPLFYSVGLLMGNEEDRKYEEMVLNPSEKTDEELDRWWEDFTAAKQGEAVTFVKEPSANEESAAITVTKMDETLGTVDTGANRYYVDKFFYASNAAELGEAFQGIVEEIRVQSGYYPTDADQDNPNYSGYLVFEDAIGKYMHVESMNGVMYQGQLYNGSNFAMKMSDNSTYEEEQEFLNSLVERLNISVESAQTLVENAKSTGQISYTSASEFSNYIGWYSDEDGTYLGGYKSDQEKPEGAAYLNKSYFYFGDSSGTMTDGADMMYLSVRVMKSLDTGEETVRFAVPASLIPIVKYNVTKTKDANENTTVETNRTLAYPVHLFYEVGLQEDINEYDLSAVDETYPHKDFTSTYRKWRFYSNAWEKTVGEAQTSVVFTPSEENEYYYHMSDATLYVKSGENPDEYQKYTGTAIDNSQTYYYKKTVYNLEGGSRDQYVAIDEMSLQSAEQSQDGSGTWIVPSKALKYEEANQTINKEKNLTGTAEYVEKSSVQNVTDTDETRNAGFGIARSLGNNGYIGIDQGVITISKQVEDFYDGELGGNKDDESTKFEFELSTEPTRTFTLADGESNSIWLPIGSEVSVIETGEIAERYKTDVTVNGNKTENTKESAKIIIASAKEAKVEFANDYNPPTAPLTLIKSDEKEAPLKGAVFHLYELICDNTDPEHIESEHNKVIVEDEYKESQSTQDKISCWKLVGESESTASGQLTFIDVENGEDLYLKRGTYRMIETKAPDGYVKPAGQWDVVIVPGGDKPYTFMEIKGENGERPPAIYVSENNFHIPNYKPVTPPVTGGRGIDRFILLGAVTVISGMMLTIHLVLQKKRGRL